MPASEGPGWREHRRVTVRDLQAATDRGEAWTMLTSYDALTAGVFEAAGVRALLVGDTAGMVVLGRDSTVSVEVDELLPMVKAVVAGTRHALVVADLPFGSYQSCAELALLSATRFVKEAGAQAIKLEGGRRVVPQVRAIVEAGIPVFGHLGLTPQSVHALGGYRVQGRGQAGDVLLEEALLLQDAGASALVLEAIPSDVAARVSAELSIPTIGIGAGPDCDAQILVWQDMLGLTSGRVPRFVKQYADLRSLISVAVAEYVADVAGGQFPAQEHSY